MAFNVQQSSRTKSWTDLLVEESEHSLHVRKAKRKLTFRRMYHTVFVLFAASLLIYCSLFYITAFFDMGKVVGVSQLSRAETAQKNITSMETTKRRTLFSPFVDVFSTNRIYLRRGQSILGTYSLPHGTDMTMKIKQCKSMPVIEVFRCRFVDQQTTVVRNKTTGFIKFTVSEPGFYYFDAEVIKRPSTLLKQNKDYRVVWQRG